MGLLQHRSRPRWPLHPWPGNPRLWPGAASPGSRDQRKGQVEPRLKEERKGADPQREAESKESCCLRSPSSGARESPVSAEPASAAAAPGTQSPEQDRRGHERVSAARVLRHAARSSCLLCGRPPAACLQRLYHRLTGNRAETRVGAQLSPTRPGFKGL